MKKITRKQRLELLKEGFYRCGHMQIKDIGELESDLARIAGQLTEEFEGKVRAINTRITIATVRSKDFIDSEGVYCGFDGKTFKYGEFLIHVYLFSDGSGAASITLLA